MENGWFSRIFGHKSNGNCALTSLRTVNICLYLSVLQNNSFLPLHQNEDLIAIDYPQKRLPEMDIQVKKLLRK